MATELARLRRLIQPSASRTAVRPGSPSGPMRLNGHRLAGLWAAEGICRWAWGCTRGRRGDMRGWRWERYGLSAPPMGAPRAARIWAPPPGIRPCEDWWPGHAPSAHRGSPSRVGPRRWSWVRVVARVQLPHPADVACRPYSGWPRQGPIRRCWAPSDHHPARHDLDGSHGGRPTPLCGGARHHTAIGTGGSDDSEALRGESHKSIISRTC
jgi:hypothetical protein